MSSDAVVVRKGVGWGYLPPIPPGAGAADRRRVGSRSRSACPVGSCRSCARCCRSDRRSTVSILEMVPVLCIRVHILASQLAITSKSNTWLFWLFVRSSTASRPLHGFGLLSLFALCLIASTVYRLFEIIFPKISFFSRALKIMTSVQSPRYASASSCGGGWVSVTVAACSSTVLRVFSSSSRSGSRTPCPLLSVSSSGVGVSY